MSRSFGLRDPIRAIGQRSVVFSFLVEPTIGSYQAITAQGTYGLRQHLSLHLQAERPPSPSHHRRRRRPRRSATARGLDNHRPQHAHAPADPLPETSSLNNLIHSDRRATNSSIEAV